MVKKGNEKIGLAAVAVIFFGVVTTFVADYWPYILAVVSVAIVSVFMAAKVDADAHAGFAQSAVDELGRMANEDGSYAVDVISPEEADYRPTKGETVHAIIPMADLMETSRDGRFVIGAISGSIPIVEGFKLRLMAGKVAYGKKTSVKDSGRIILTNKAVVFDGYHSNERITHSQVMSCVVGPSTVIVERRTGPDRVFRLGAEHPRFSAIMAIMMNREEL